MRVDAVPVALRILNTRHGPHRYELTPGPLRRRRGRDLDLAVGPGIAADEHEVCAVRGVEHAGADDGALLQLRPDGLRLGGVGHVLAAVPERVRVGLLGEVDRAAGQVRLVGVVAAVEVEVGVVADDGEGAPAYRVGLWFALVDI